MLAISSRSKGLQRPIKHLRVTATSVSRCTWCSHHEILNGMSTLSALSILLVTHADCAMQNPEDCAIKEELANAEDLMQQSLRRCDPPKLHLDPQSGSHNIMANYVGPLKLINIPGTCSPAASTSYKHYLYITANDWLMYLVCVLSPIDLHLLNHVASTSMPVTYQLHTTVTP